MKIIVTLTFIIINLLVTHINDGADCYVLYLSDDVPIAWGPFSRDYTAYDTNESDEIKNTIPDCTGYDCSTSNEVEDNEIGGIDVDCATEYGDHDNEMPKEVSAETLSSAEKGLSTTTETNYLSSSEISDLIDKLENILNNNFVDEDVDSRTNILHEVGSDEDIIVPEVETDNVDNVPTVLILGFGNDDKSTFEAPDNELTRDIQIAAQALAELIENEEEFPNGMEWMDDIEEPSSNTLRDNNYIFFDMGSQE